MRINTLGDLIMYNRNSFRTFPSVYITAANKKFRLKNQLFALFCIFVCGFFSSVYCQNCQNYDCQCLNFGSLSVDDSVDEGSFADEGKYCQNCQDYDC